MRAPGALHPQQHKGRIDDRLAPTSNDEIINPLKAVYGMSLLPKKNSQRMISLTDAHDLQLIAGLKEDKGD